MKILLLIGLLMPIFNVSFGQTAANNGIVCTEKQRKSKDGFETELVKTCTWSDYRTVSVCGERYCKTTLYKSVGGKYVKIENERMFNERRAILLKSINEDVKKTFDGYKGDLENALCMEELESSPVLDFDGLVIGIDEEGIYFEYGFGLPGVCDHVNGGRMYFKPRELEAYILK